MTTKTLQRKCVQFCRSILICIMLLPGLGGFENVAVAAENPPEKAQWSRTMGQSGLRRFYATGAELGELVNRQVSYQIANRYESLQKQQNAATGKPVENPESDVEGYVAQYDSLVPLESTLQHPLFIRTLARVAQRLEPDKVHSRNDRYDLALLYAPSPQSYLGFGVAVEETRVDLKYVTGNTFTRAVGPRFDAGFMLTSTLGLGVRLEELNIRGDNQVTARTPAGLIDVERTLDYRRRFFQVETISRLGTAQLKFLPAGMQLGGMAGIHYLDTSYERQINSLGQTVNEPFGNHERLGVFRSGLFASKNIGSANVWNAYADLMLDHEFDNNLNHPIDDRTSTLMRLGIARLLGPGKRISLDYQRSQSWNGVRERNNFLLIAVIDF